MLNENLSKLAVLYDGLSDNQIDPALLCWTDLISFFNIRIITKLEKDYFITIRLIKQFEGSEKGTRTTKISIHNIYKQSAMVH